jgi:hypothetical protein
MNSRQAFAKAEGLEQDTLNLPRIFSALPKSFLAPKENLSVRPQTYIDLVRAREKATWVRIQIVDVDSIHGMARQGRQW